MFVHGVHQGIVRAIRKIAGMNHIQNDWLAADCFNRLEGGDKAIAILLIAPGNIDGLLGRLVARGGETNRHGGGDGCADLLCFLGCHDQAVLIVPLFPNRTEKCYHAIRHKPVTTRIREAFRSNDYPYEKALYRFCVETCAFYRLNFEFRKVWAEQASKG